MAKTVRIAGNQFPEEVRPGAEISYTDPWAPDPFETHRGTVIDRAPQGETLDSGRYWQPQEASGVWLWVMPEGERNAVRVRYYSSGERAGQAHRDKHAMVIRTMNGTRLESELERATA